MKVVQSYAQQQQSFSAEQSDVDLEPAPAEHRHPFFSAVGDTVDGTAHLVAAASLATMAVSASGAEAATDGAHTLSTWAARGLSRFARWLGIDSKVSLTDQRPQRPSDTLWHQAGAQLGKAADDFAHVAEASANATDL